MAPFSPTINLVCSVLLTMGEAWVELPVAREIWEEDGPVRDMLTDKVRSELAAVVLKETGLQLDDAFLATLPVTVQDPDVGPAGAPSRAAECAVVCVGGPRDGTRLKLDRAHPGLAVQLPLEEPLSALFEAAAGKVAPIRRALYVPIVEGGRCSRADDGAWRFRWDGDC
ncbi:hypothetical protein [Streptomyces acidicola]|uniref:Uncharacterized protein n=1 Tax=Streptomyces acidicola TaxID=2596892 RepID=A0A5N8WI91_9ACTN|nr:hypothetical protein [Streptomyces acidicola]MPY47190.1 hypothetical protein [Streptomyces acidicola]MPY47329.1 hypothetical protein [Streptomyces acidicola]